MVSMIDRIGRAICQSEDGGADGTECGLIGNTCDVCSSRGAEVMQKNARAVLAAMREPTEAMHEAGNDELDRVDGAAFCESIWQIMIDAALAEKSE